MAESHASAGPGILGIHSSLLTGQSMGRFRNPMWMEEPSRNFISQIHFDVEAPGVSGGVKSVGGLAEAHVTTDRRVSLALPEDFPADSRGGHQPTAQSTRYPISPHRLH